MTTGSSISAPEHWCHTVGLAATELPGSVWLASDALKEHTPDGESPAT